jgi:putative ABC transport system permease protein
MKQIPQNLQPPKWPARLLRAVCPPELTEELLGDLHEQFLDEAAAGGEQQARRKYVIETLKFVRPYFLARKSNNSVSRKKTQFIFITLFSSSGHAA